MNHRYLSAIGAAFGFVVFTAQLVAAQSELPTRPAPTQPVDSQPAPAAPKAPNAPLIPGYYPANAIGLEVGWGAPYGWGVQYTRMVSSHFDVNGGFGIGVGGKIGVGVRYYVRPDRPVSGYFGASLARSGRIDNFDLTLNQEQTRLSLKPSGVLHLRGGMRWQPGSVGLLGTIGYGARLTGDPAVFDTVYYGEPSQEMRNLVRTISPGGLEVSIGVLFGFGR